MGTFVLWFIIGLFFSAGLTAFIGLVSKDNGQGRQEYRGYQPNKPLDGPPPTRGTAYKNYLMTRRGIRRR